MKNKILIISILLLSTGCASLKYPNWDKVKIENSVVNKPCVKIGTKELCSDSRENCDIWFKKRATLVKANAIVINNKANTNEFVSEYYHCAPGLPVNKKDLHIIISNKFNLLATKLDYEKTIAKCKFESSKAELSGVVNLNQDKAIMFGLSDDEFSNFTNTLGQMSANSTNEMRAKDQRDQRKNALSALYQQCIDADGFKYENVLDKDLTEEMKQKCPDLASSIEPCLMLK